MRILLDTNIIHEVLLDREPFAHVSRCIWEAADAGVFDACIASFTLPTIHYICQRHAGPVAAGNAVDICLEAFEVCPLYRECILAARRIPGNDFEDNLQVACAITDFVPGIVTRDPRGFANAAIRVYTPAELLESLRQ